MITEIQKLLSRLGITANYVGFFHTSYAVLLAIEDIERLSLVTKRLYPEVAKCCNTTAKCVERNIRTAIQIAWSENPDLLNQLAKGGITVKPTAARFIAMIAAHFL